MCTIFHNIMKSLTIGIVVLLLSLSGNAFASTKNPLTPDKAFQLSVSIKNANEVNAIFHVAPGYFLYRKHLKFSTEPDIITSINFPDAVTKINSDGQSQAVYSGEVIIPIFFKTSASPVSINIQYQGCSKNGFCYPPLQKKILLSLPNSPAMAEASPSISSLLTNQNSIHNFINTNNTTVIIFLFIGLGLLLGLTPCVLPMVPILTSLIVGQKQSLTTRQAFLLATTYVFGMAITYALAGIAAAMLGNSLQAWLQQPWIIASVALLFVLLALSLFDFYSLRLPGFLNNRLQQLYNKTEGGRFTGVFSMGVVSTLVVSPCVTAPLVGILMYVSQTGNMVFGATALFALGAGMGIPLLLIGISAGRWLPKTGPWMLTIKKFFGFMMLGTAIWMLSRILPPDIVMILWGALCLLIALYFGLILQRPTARQLIQQTAGGLSAFAGVMFIMGGIGLSNPMSDWLYQPSKPMTKSFIMVQNISEFEQQLARATANRKPVILDFYADWCESCVAMDKKVFNLPDVKNRLSQFTVLRADLSAHSKTDDTLLNYFNVIAPPTILFFDPEGHEIDSQRIVGEVNAKEFLARLNP